MDRMQAAAVLGVTSDANAAQVKKAFLARARLLHPDRLGHGASADEIKSANEAMAQLNLANSIMQEPPTRSNSGSARTRDQAPPENYGFPVWSEGHTSCDMCGWGPAKNVKFYAVTGLIIFLRTYTFDAKMCRSCALGIYNEAQRNTLLKGWWGIFSFFVTIVTFILNASHVNSVKSMLPPQGRYPGAYSLSPVPLPALRPWWKSPGSMIASAIAIGVTVMFVAGAVDDASRPTAPASIPTTPTPEKTQSFIEKIGNESGYLGTCWADFNATQVERVPCSDIRADWTVTSEERSIPNSEQSRCQTENSLRVMGLGTGSSTQWDLCIQAVN